MQEVANCICCGSNRYQIQHLYTGYRQRLLIVQCGDCKDEVIHVVVDGFCADADIYEKCRTAWNAANEVPNA